MLTRFCCSALLLIVTSFALASARQTNSDNVRPVPSPGIEVFAADRAEPVRIVATGEIANEKPG